MSILESVAASAKELEVSVVVSFLVANPSSPLIVTVSVPSSVVMVILSPAAMLRVSVVVSAATF